MPRPVFPLILTALLLTGLPAASMTISVSPEPPPMTGVLVGYDADDDVGSYLCTHGTQTVVDLGQTFRLSQLSILDRITLKLRPLTDRTAGELVLLVLGAFAGPGDDSMDELLAYEIQVLPSTLPTGEVRYVTFDIADFPLEAERQYGFSLGFVGGGNVNNARLEVLHVGEDAYPDGLAIEKAGAVTTALPNDLVFFLHTEVLFADGFESGDAGAWSATHP